MRGASRETFRMRQLNLLGAAGILTLEDLPALNAANMRVLRLLTDRRWHTASEIVAVAQGSEGLRRLRELRRHGYEIEHRRVEGKRLFEYRMK